MPELKWLRYGNWCGPGPYGDDDPPVKNKVDNACKRHDIGYKDCGALDARTSIRAALPGGANLCTNKYDKAFVDELNDLINSKQVTGREKVVAQLIRRYFRFKMQYDLPARRETPPQPALRKPMSFRTWLGGQE